jgi:hypothetical protein
MLLPPSLSRLCLIAALAIVGLAALPARDAAAWTKWCPTGVAIDSVTVSEIGSGTVLQRGDVHYLEGNVVHVDVKHSACSWISAVKAGPTFLGTSGGIEPSSQYYQVISTSVTVDGKLSTRLRLTLANLGLGDDKPVEIRVTKGTTTVASTVTIAPVLTVNTDTDQGTLGFSEADVNNRLVESLFVRYNAPAGRAIDLDDPPDGVPELELYAIEFGDLGTTIDEDGLHFDLTFKATTAEPTGLPCDPTITISADFKLTIAQLTTLGVEWNNGVGPTADVDVPTGCVVAAEIVLLLVNPVVAAGGLVAYPFFIDYLEEMIAETIRDDIEQAVAAAFPAGATGGTGQLAGLTLGPDYLASGEVRVYPVLTETVTVRVPYDDSRRTSAGYGMPIASGDQPLVLPAGTAEICSNDNQSWPGCTHVLTGPMGVYYAPYHVPNHGIWVGDHLKLYNGVRKVQRWAGAPPWVGVAGDLDYAEHNVGRMLGRYVTPGTFVDVLLGDACRLPEAVGRGKITFGVNDTQPGGNPRGSGDYLATVVFLPAEVAEEPTACRTRNVGTAVPPIQ